MEGLFVLAVSSFEHSILDTVKVYLIHLPNKLDIKTENIAKNELIDGDPLSQAIENKINSVSYKSIAEILDYFIKITSLDNYKIEEAEINILIEIKASRNLLIHNNLIVNNIYKDTAGPNIRKASNKGRLKIEKDYLNHVLVSLIDVLDKIKRSLITKYSSFTKIKATRNLFDYFFNTPILLFDDIFIVDEKHDEISSINSKKINRIKNNLSSSERLFLDIWLAHFSYNEFNFKSGSIYSLDIRRRKELQYFIDVVDLLKT